MLFSHWEPLSSCRPHLCTCCCYRQHGGIPARTTQQMFMTVCVSLCACIRACVFCVWIYVSLYHSLNVCIYTCVCVYVCIFVDKASCPSTSFAIWIIDCLLSLKKIKGEGMCHNVPLLKRPCFYLFSHSILFVWGAASCHHDYEEGIMGRDYASLCNVWRWSMTWSF